MLFVKDYILISGASAVTSILDRMEKVSENNYDTTQNSPTAILGSVISVGLGLLGVIFVILVIAAGYKWMMAGGDAKKIDESKDSMWRAVIGLIITVSAYAIKNYVFGNL